MSAAEVELAQQRTEVADVGVEAAKLKLEAAKKAVELAEVGAEHAKQRLELERLRLEHVDCCALQEVPSPTSSPAHKRARTAEGEEPAPAPPAVALPVVAAAPQDAADPVAAAQQELSVARRELQELEACVLRQRKEQQQTSARLLASRSRHRDCTASRLSAAEEAKWFKKDLDCSSKALANEAARKKFIDELSKAPCLRSLSLHLRSPEGKDEEDLPLPLPQSVLQVLPALSAAPSRIKKLWCFELCDDGREAVFTLLERARGHLDEFMISSCSSGALYHEDVRRLWALLVGSNVSKLMVAPVLLRDVGFVLKAGDWPRLQRVEAEGFADYHWTKDELALLAPLLRVNMGNLRAVSLPWKIKKEMRQAVFEALAACTGLEELGTPCYEELGLLTTCSKLSKLKVHRINRSDYGKDTDQDIQAVSRFLRAPSTASRLESFHLNSFQFQYNERHRAHPIYEAVRDFKKLKSLTLEVCNHFDEVLGDTLKALPCLEELHLLHCRWLYAEVVTKHVMPENAPNLKLLELDTQEIYEPSSAKKWRRKMWDVESDFRRANRDFRLVDHIEEQFHGGLSPDSDSYSWF